jgi:hypothetical protein
MPEISDILDVTIEDLSPEQLQQLKDATDQFQQKCLMSFKKNRSGVPYLKNVGGDLEKEEAGLLLLEVRNNLSRGSAPVGRGSDGSFPCPQGGTNRAPSHRPRC